MDDMGAGRGEGMVAPCEGAEAQAAELEEVEEGSLRQAIAPGSFLRYPVPERSAERARAWVADPASCEPVQPRKAATVMLLRDGRMGRFIDARGCSPEVFVIKRAATMAFVPGAIAFPGGGVDARDAESDVPWRGPVPAEWAARMGCGEDEARSVVAAAAREVFEETGVLLASPAGSEEAPAPLSAEELAADRARVEGRELSFGDYLCERGLELRSDLLSLRSHWVTPVYEPRRYDTYFFAAKLPLGQQADGRTSEAEASGWFTPQLLLSFLDEGSVSIMPPTVSNLVTLTQAATVAEALALPFSGHVLASAALDEDGNPVLQCEVG